jgi:hypothetical protein
MNKPNITLWETSLCQQLMHQKQRGVLNIIALRFPTGALLQNGLPKALLFETASSFYNISIAAVMKIQNCAEFLPRKRIFISKKAKRDAIIFFNEGA